MDDPPRPFFLTPTSSDDHSSQETHELDNNSDSESPRTRSRVPPVPRARNHRRRRSQLGPGPDGPPSSFNFPFQAYPGNPDPVPGLIPSHRRMSLDSSRSPSAGHYDPHPLPSPLPPRDHSPYKSFNGSVSLANLHRASTATADPLPRVSSATTFRSPFLSPASRPSSLWSPPPLPPPSTSPSILALPLPQKKPLQSTRLHTKLTKEDKPWLAKGRPHRRWESASWWITFLTVVAGLLGAAAICYLDWGTVNILTDSQLCIVLEEDFTSSSLDSNSWTLDVELGGFGSVTPFFHTTTVDPSLVTGNSK